MRNCIRGTLHAAIDTNFRFHQDFFGQYKGVDFKYVLGQKEYTDCIIATIDKNEEQTYQIITELISIFSYVLDKGFIIQDSMHDMFCGKLCDRQPGCSQKRMLNVDVETNKLSNYILIGKCPNINTDHKSSLVRLYRLARVEEYVNKISSFLFYYHILDYHKKGKSNIAATFINSFEIRNDLATHIIDDIKSINNNRVFDKQYNHDNPTVDNKLGNYIKFKVRDSVGHIVRRPNTNAHNLKIDSFAQAKHFHQLVGLMRNMARTKLEEVHEFNQCCDEETLSIKF